MDNQARRVAVLQLWPMQLLIRTRLLLEKDSNPFPNLGESVEAVTHSLVRSDPLFALEFARKCSVFF